MPDEWGFNRLGPEVACVECDERGPLVDWPTAKRQEHHLEHIEMAKGGLTVKQAMDAAKGTLQLAAAVPKTAVAKPAAKKPAVRKSAKKPLQ